MNTALQKCAVALTALAGVTLTSPVLAQKPAVPEATQPSPPHLDSKACADRERARLGDTRSGDTQETQGAAVPKDSLSDKLARTDGVICPPPDIDPDVRQPAPGGGNMPVIPPPGAPGGDPSIQPK